MKRAKIPPMKHPKVVFGLRDRVRSIHIGPTEPLPFELYEVVESDDRSRWMVEMIEPATGEIRFCPFEAA